MRPGLTCAAGGGLGDHGLFLGPAGALPYLARGGGLLAGAPRFALGFLQALARALQFFLGDAHALLGDVRLEPGALEGLCRGGRLAAVLLHPLACKGERSASLTQAPEGCHRVTYPQNLCITMWTEAARSDKRAALPMVCVKVSAISPAARKTT